MVQGDHISFELISSDDVYTGKVIKDEPLNTKSMNGSFVTIEVEGYGIVQVYQQGNMITSNSILDRMKRSVIPAQFSSVRWPDFKWSYYGPQMKESREISIARKFISNNQYFRENNRGLYIYGKIPGCGKTMLGCMLANEIIYNHSFSVKYIKQSDYLDLGKSDETAAKETFRSIRDCILLFLDDFGPCSTSWQRETIFGLIEHRQRQGHITVYMSQIPPDKIRLDDSHKANDLINASTFGLMLPDIPIRANIAAEENKRLEQELMNL